MFCNSSINFIIAHGIRVVEENEQTGINRSESNPAFAGAPRRIFYQRRSLAVVGDPKTATNFTRVRYGKAKRSMAKLFTDRPFIERRRGVLSRAHPFAITDPADSTPDSVPTV